MKQYTEQPKTVKPQHVQTKLDRVLYLELMDAAKKHGATNRCAALRLAVQHFVDREAA